MPLIRFAIILLILVSTGSLSAKEYENYTQYKAKTGKEELTRKDWLKKDRINNTRQWVEACKYNFSYQGGSKEYQTMEERLGFYKWVSDYLTSRGHKIAWPEATEELSRYMLKTQRPTFDNDIRLFCRGVHKVVFDTAFSILQEVKNLPNPIIGSAAEIWDKEMFFFEHTEIYQPLIVKMDKQSLTKLNKIMDRKGFAAFSLPIELKMKGDVENMNDRLSWAEKKLLPFVKGDAPSASEIRNRERVLKKEREMNAKKKEEVIKPVIIKSED